MSKITPDAYDPIQEVANVPPSGLRRIFVAGDKKDTLIPIAAQQAYADALVRHGVKVAVATSTAVDPQRHVLVNTALRTAGWCLDGLSDSEILERRQLGEVANLLPGEVY